MQSGFLKKYIGDKGFYAMILSLMLPMVVQQGITQFVNLLDNVMVGQLGTESMSGVAIVNQIMMVFNLTIFGGLSGIAIYGAQFFGKGDMDGFKNTFRLRIYFVLIALVAGILIFLLFGEQVVSLYLNEENSDPESLSRTLEYAKQYLFISLFGLLPFVIVQCFSSALRDTGETFSPMVASVIAILMNLVLNYLLIFGNFNFPKMGVAGAALATVIARWAEMLYLVIYTYAKSYKFTFVKGLFSTFKVPLSMVGIISRTTFPLLINETLWSVGMAMVNVCYSTRGLDAVAAINIHNTIWNLFTLIMMAMGNAVGILSGQLLGANEIDRAKDMVRKLLFTCVCVNILVGVLIIASSPFIPLIYNVEQVVRDTASKLLLIGGCFLPLISFVHCSYFTIRSGGKTGITFIFDCGSLWLVCIPVAFLLANFTNLPLELVFLGVTCTDVVKAVIGGIMLKSGIWAKNVVNRKELSGS